MNLVISLICTYPPFIENTYFEFQVYMFNNGRDMTKCQFLPDSDAKAIAILWVFSENS